MHHIRFLKPPRVAIDSSRALTAKITITTDLGEAFLAVDVELVVELDYVSSNAGPECRRQYTWRGSAGMRALEVVIPIAARSPAVKLLVRPKDEKYDVKNFDSVLENLEFDEDEDDHGGILAVRSMPVDVTVQNKVSVGLAERVFGTEIGGKESKVHIWEETGESIARHIWYANKRSPVKVRPFIYSSTYSHRRDAGLVLSSYLATLPYRKNQALQPLQNFPRLPMLEELLKNRSTINAIELGAGCGIVSITISQHYSNVGQLLLTDLPEASEILAHNLSVASASSAAPSSSNSKRKAGDLSHQVLDWSHPLPINVRTTKWDLVLVADCTYNPDVVPDLVATLGRTVEGNRECLVCLAMKVRHESEMVFFELMREREFEVMESCKVPLPVLGAEMEEIEIFVFGSGKV